MRLISAFLFIFLTIIPAYPSDIQVKGSDTIVRLTQQLAEVYMKSHPADHIAVSGGGSGTGIAAIINGTTDIADASRSMKASELAQASTRHREPLRVVIAVDAVTFIVHPSNPVRRLTTAQIGAIFRGEIRNWKDVGGPDLPITLYGRQSSSGTFVFVREYLLKGEYAPVMTALQGNAEILEAVRFDRSAIGYVGMAFARDTGIAPVMIGPPGKTIDPLSRADVVAGRYPLTRPLYQYVKFSPDSTAALDFVRFELGPEGQKIIENEGYLPVIEPFLTENTRAGF